MLRSPLGDVNREAEGGRHERDNAHFSTGSYESGGERLASCSRQPSAVIAIILRLFKG
jgi:hypothetical protein